MKVYYTQEQGAGQLPPIASLKEHQCKRDYCAWPGKKIYSELNWN
jgi:hypothetical protein